MGKTSIISRYINNTFLSNSMSTTGASFSSKTMYFEKYDKYVKFEVSILSQFRYGTQPVKKNIDQ